MKLSKPWACPAGVLTSLVEVLLVVPFGTWELQPWVMLWLLDDLNKLMLEVESEEVEV